MTSSINRTENFKLYHSLRANKQMSKVYIVNKLNEFMPLYIKAVRPYDNDCIDLQVCKQDSRGALSISIGSKRGTICSQRFFGSQAELMAFVEGFMLAQPIAY